jgi:hypothetical protein
MAYSYDRQIASAGACVHLIGHMQGDKHNFGLLTSRINHFVKCFCPMKTIGLSAGGGDAVIHWWQDGRSHSGSIVTQVADEDAPIVVSGEVCRSRNGVKTNSSGEF